MGFFGWGGNTDLTGESHRMPPQLHQNENSRCGFREVLCTRVRVRSVRVKEGLEALKIAGTFRHGLRGSQGSELSWVELL